MQTPGATTAPLRRYLILVGAGFVILGLLNPAKGIGLLPLQFVLKRDLHFSPLDMARFFSIAGIAWYVKPLAAVLTDHFPLFGVRRESYMLLGTVSVALLWMLIGYGARAPWALLSLVSLLTVMFVLCQAPLSALVVEGGRSFAATGRLSTSRRVADYVAMVLVGPISGFLALYPLQYSGTVCGVLATVLAVIILRFRTGEAASARRETWADLRRSILGMLAHRPMWMASAMFFLLSISPGFQTPLFYYKTDTLHFSPQLIGMLAMVSASCSIVGAGIYAWACRKRDLRFLLSVAVMMDATAAGLFVFYDSFHSALAIDAMAGLMRGFVWMPILDLLVRSVPKGNEAIGAALEWSPANLAVALSDLLGSWLYQHQGVTFKSLAWMDGATTLLILFLVPLLPQSVMDRREGQLAEEVEVPV